MPHTYINLSNPRELSIMIDYISPDDLRFFDRSDDFDHLVRSESQFLY